MSNKIFLDKNEISKLKKMKLLKVLDCRTEWEHKKRKPKGSVFVSRFELVDFNFKDNIIYLVISSGKRNMLSQVMKVRKTKKLIYIFEDYKNWKSI